MTFNVQRASLCLLEVDIFRNCTGGRGLESRSTMYPIVSDAMLQIVLTVNSLIINSFVIAVGIATNIINVIVFVKLSFSDTTNISLLAMTISDLASLLVKILQIILNPIVFPDDLNIDVIGIRFLAFGVPYGWLTLTTSWLTVYIVLERYLCVLTPLKVKMLITPKRNFLAVVIIYVLMALASAPTYYTNRLEWIYNPSRNRTILKLIARADSVSESAMIYSINVFLQAGSYLGVVALTTALIVNLAEKSKWRKRTTVSSDTISHRDSRVSQMIIFICVIFVVCYSPMTTVILWGVVDPEVTAVGANKNLFSAFVVSASLAQAINSSLNLFVYLKMSTKYRKVFYTLFRRNDPVATTVLDGIK